MPRVPEITSKSELPADKHPIFDAIAESRGRVAIPFSLLLNSPEVAGRIAHLGTYLRFETALPPAEQELAIITAARESDCEFEYAAHTRLAREAGVREEAIEVVGNRRPTDQLTEAEALIVSYGRELLRDHRVSDDTFEAARAKYGNKGVTDLTALFGYYTMMACCLNAFQVRPAPGATPLP